jgi:hypothetical protein
MTNAPTVTRRPTCGPGVVHIGEHVPCSSVVMGVKFLGFSKMRVIGWGPKQVEHHLVKVEQVVGISRVAPHELLPKRLHLDASMGQGFQPHNTVDPKQPTSSTQRVVHVVGHI